MRPDPPVPTDELERLKKLVALRLLDTPPEQSYDDLTRLAAHICETPMSFVSLVDRDRQWFKARFGVEVAETPRRDAFCAHGIVTPGAVMVVPDASRDARFADNPLVTGEPHIRFYAGAPLTMDGVALGMLCVIDRVPRTLKPTQIEALEALARQVVAQMELRKALIDVGEAIETIKVLRGLLPICAWCHKIRDQAGNWGPLETYLSRNTDVVFSHGICPDCAPKVLAGRGGD